MRVKAVADAGLINNLRDYYESGSQINRVARMFSEIDHQHWTFLHYCAFKGNNDCVKLMIELKADLNCNIIAKQNDKAAGCRNRISRQITPLHLAIQNGHLETIKILLEAGAKLCSRENLLLCSDGYFELDRFIPWFELAETHNPVYSLLVSYNTPNPLVQICLKEINLNNNENKITTPQEALHKLPQELADKLDVVILYKNSNNNNNNNLT